MSKQIILDADYKPSDDEPFMNDHQRCYRGKLLAWKDEIPERRRRPWLPSRARARITRTSPTGLLGDGPRHRTARPRPAAQADRQDRCGHLPDRRWFVRLLRGNRRAHLAEAPGSPPDRHALARSPGASRAQRARVPGRLKTKPYPPCFSRPRRATAGLFMKAHLSKREAIGLRRLTL